MTSKTDSVPFDSNALNGLRGLAALHILLFHALFYTEYRFNIYGQVSYYPYGRETILIVLVDVELYI